MKEYKIEHWPKFKRQPNLSKYQLLLRRKATKYVYKETFTCNECFKCLSIDEFYIRDKITGRRNHKCRDCLMRQMGVIEIGKQRFAFKIFDNGFRRCSICKDIQPLINFPKNRGQYKGVSNTCKKCAMHLHKEFIYSQRATLGDSYVKQHSTWNGISLKTKEEKAKYRKKILESRNPKYFLDGKEFFSINAFARYVETVYKVGFHSVCKRINSGKTEKECTMSEHDMRSRAYTKGRIKLTDIKTNKKWVFINTCDPKLSKLLSGSSVQKGLRTKFPVGGYRGSKHPNPFLVERLLNGS